MVRSRNFEATWQPGERPVDAVNLIYAELAFPREKVREALMSDAPPDVKKNAYYLAHYIRMQVDELKAIAAEIDVDYQAAETPEEPSPSEDPQ